MDVMKLSVSKEFIISTQPIGCITGNWIPLDDQKVYRIASNTYIAAGKDGYNSLLKREDLPNKGDYVDSGIGENEMFMEYAEAQGNLTALPYRHLLQTLISKLAIKFNGA